MTRADLERAPYGSVRALLRFLAQARRRGWPERVDILFLEGLGFRGGAAWELLLALRFLGLVDEEGRPLPRYGLVLADEEGVRRGLREAVYAAYAPLWETLDVTNASRQELEAGFRRWSPARARRQARFLVGLCRAAGIPVAARFRGRLSIAQTTLPGAGDAEELRRRLERAEAELARLRALLGREGQRRPWWRRLWDMVRKGGRRDRA